MGDPHGDPQTSPHFADPHGFLVWLSLFKGTKSMWIGVLWAGLRVAMWITHVGVKFRHGLLETDLFSRRFREGISFPNFVERSILELPLSKLFAVPFALQNGALFKGEKRAKSVPRKRGQRGGQQRGQKGQKDA